MTRVEVSNILENNRRNLPQDGPITIHYVKQRCISTCSGQISDTNTDFNYEREKNKYLELDTQRSKSKFQ